MNFLWLSLCWATPWPVLAENEHTLPPSIQVSKWMIPQDSWAVTTPILTPERLAIAAKNTSNFILQNKYNKLVLLRVMFWKQKQNTPQNALYYSPKHRIANATRILASARYSAAC